MGHLINDIKAKVSPLHCYQAGLLAAQANSLTLAEFGGKANAKKQTWPRCFIMGS
jgi:hypothetical protein